VGVGLSNGIERSKVRWEGAPWAPTGSQNGARAEVRPQRVRRGAGALSAGPGTFPGIAPTPRALGNPRKMDGSGTVAHRPMAATCTVTFSENIRSSPMTAPADGGGGSKSPDGSARPSRPVFAVAPTIGGACATALSGASPNWEGVHELGRPERAIVFVRGPWVLGRAPRSPEHVEHPGALETHLGPTLWPADCRTAKNAENIPLPPAGGGVGQAPGSKSPPQVPAPLCTTPKSTRPPAEGALGPPKRRRLQQATHHANFNDLRMKNDRLDNGYRMVPKPKKFAVVVPAGAHGCVYLY
jgi:hypothetical protein